MKQFVNSCQSNKYGSFLIEGIALTCSRLHVRQEPKHLCLQACARHDRKL